MINAHAHAHAHAHAQEHAHVTLMHMLACASMQSTTLTHIDTVIAWHGQRTDTHTHRHR